MIAIFFFGGGIWIGFMYYYYGVKVMWVWGIFKDLFTYVILISSHKSFGIYSRENNCMSF